VSCKPGGLVVMVQVEVAGLMVTAIGADQLETTEGCVEQRALARTL
jgi:hypothetical protein